MVFTPLSSVAFFARFHTTNKNVDKVQFIAYNTNVNRTDTSTQRINPSLAQAGSVFYF